VAVDSSSTAQRIIQGNAVALGLGAVCTVLRMTVQTALDRLGKEDRRFEVVLADPPYAEDADQLIEAIARADVLAPGALLVLEHSRRGAPARIPPGLELVVRRRHGDTELSLYGANGVEP
jgi:16S rRNA (guanine966-N2)-methyltransferase